MTEPILKKIISVGILVRDLDKTIKFYTGKYGIGPWNIYLFNPDNTVPAEIGNEYGHSFKVAVCFLQETCLKLIQPPGKTGPLANYLKAYGEGLHHIEYQTDDLSKAIRFFRERGINTLMSGNSNNRHKFFYLDTFKELKHLAVLSQEDPFLLKAKGAVGIKLPGQQKTPYPFPDFSRKEKIIKPIFKSICQVALIVNNIEETVKIYYDQYGIGPWRIRTFGPESVREMMVRGRHRDYRMEVAITRIGNIDLELIQPKDDQSIYYEFIKTKGEGLHHIAYAVDNFPAAMEYMDKLSIPVLMSGSWNGKHSWTYLDTQDDLKHIIELNYTQEGYVFPPPDGNYPAGAQR